MITYTLICPGCNHVDVLVCSIKEWDTKVKPGTSCDCGERHHQIIQGGTSFGLRTPFPRGDYELQMPTPDHEPTIFRDKKEAKGRLEEYDLTSIWCENDM